MKYIVKPTTKFQQDLKKYKKEDMIFYNRYN